MLLILEHLHQRRVQPSSKPVTPGIGVLSFLTEIQMFPGLYCAVLCQIRSWLFFPGGNHTHKSNNATAGIVTFKDPLLVIAAYNRKRWRHFQTHGLVWWRVGVLRFSMNIQPGSFLLFTGDFAIKARECDGEGLHGTKRVVEVQRENVISYPSKLHHNVVHWKKARGRFNTVSIRDDKTCDCYDNLTVNSDLYSFTVETKPIDLTDRYSQSLLWTIWKFLMEACVTLPLKLSTWDEVSSFHTGVLLWSSIRLSNLLFWYLINKPSQSCKELA